MARLLTLPDVAGKLGISVQAFYKRRKALEQAGFPAECKPFRSRWSEDQVDAWINRQPAPPEPSVVAAAANTDWAATLKRRARG